MSAARGVLITLVVLLLSACGSSTSPFSPMPGGGTRLAGSVASAAGPIASASVTLYLAGSAGPRGGATVLAHTVSDANGDFSLRYSRPSQGVVYAVAIGGSTGGNKANAAIGLIGIAGRNGRYAAGIKLDEFTTVADEFALAQFTGADGTDIGASATNGVGVDNAARLATVNLANAATGSPAAFWPAASSCAGTAAPDNCDGLERLNALANALAACATSSSSSSSACASLRTLSHGRGTTLAAIHAVVLNPAHGVAELFALSRQMHHYEPATSAVPSAWFLALKYIGNGHEFDGPGAMAIDAAGNVWANNNYVFKEDHTIPTCGGKQLLELTPVGNDAPGAPFEGGGINGVGWGIALDAQNNVWLGNFGFAGKNCKNKPPANSVSEMDSSGHPISPKTTGFTDGSISRPQATTIDQSNNLWIANYGDRSITEYPATDHTKARRLRHTGVDHPFSIAADARGDLWITSSGNDSVVAIHPDGRPLPGSPYTGGGIMRPLGGALDSRGNFWISNSTGNSVTALDAAGKPFSASPYKGGGVRLPWGITVDGNDNVWVADFSGTRPRVSELCGVRHAHCGGVSHTGDPISPQQGYASGLLQRLTGISVDASGDVWVCNNWLPIPIQTNPGGDALVEFVGVAGPVKTPMLGLPKQP